MPTSDGAHFGYFRRDARDDEKRAKILQRGTFRPFRPRRATERRYGEKQSVSPPRLAFNLLGFFLHHVAITPFMKISTKIFATTSLIAGLSVAILALVTLRGADDAMLDLSRQYVLDVVNQEARLFRDQVAMVRGDLALLTESGISVIAAETQGQATDRRQPLADQIDAMMRERTSYAQIQIRLGANASPRALRSRREDKNIVTDINPPIVETSLEHFFEEHGGVRGADVLSAWQHPFRPPKSDEIPQGPLYLHFVTPIFSDAHVLIGVIAITVDLDRFAAPLESGVQGVHLALTDYAGRYVYRPQADRQLPALRLSEELPIGDQWTHWLSHNTPELVFDPANGYWLGDFHRISLSGPIASGDDPFLVLAGFAIPSQNAGLRLHEFKRQFVVLALAVCLLVLLTTILGARYLGRPIERLIEAVNRIAAGERNVDIPAGVSHEFGELATSVIRMADALHTAAKSREQATLGRMASMIAHDLRNALSAVKMNLSILANHHRSQPGHLQNSCEIAQGQVDYMENILRDMLDFARPENLSIESVDLAETIRIAEVSLLPKLKAKSIALYYERDGQPLQIQADRTKLLQLFHNLLDNAIAACRKEGCISIDIQPLLFESRPAAQIAITDDGDGIPLSIRDKIFEPFFTTRTKGTGLGLAIVQRIITQHGGSIRVEAAEPHGTRILIVLPLTALEESSVQKYLDTAATALGDEAAARHVDGET